jgi:hypothetical protein
LNDQLSINFQDGLDKYLNDKTQNDKPPNDETLYDKGNQKLDNLLNFVEKNSLRQQDPVTGNTCLHQVAMLSNFFSLLLIKSICPGQAFPARSDNYGQGHLLTLACSF